MTAHWAEKYIGRPWANGASGPESFDCYGLVRAVYAAERGIDLPVICVDAHAPMAVRHAMASQSEYSHWIEIDGAPQDFDVVLMSAARHPHHVGVWVAGGMLHAVEGAGVVHQSRASLAGHGWHMVVIYRRKGAA